MRLIEFEEKTERITHDHPSGARWLPDYVDRDGESTRVDLFRLSDYLVSSVTGGAIWLVKRSDADASKRP